jgi:hypothetical protein
MIDYSINIKKDFSSYSLILIDSENNFSDIGKIIEHTFRDGVHKYFLSFYGSDKFMKLMDSFEFILTVEEKKEYNKLGNQNRPSERVANLYKVSEQHSYKIVREPSYYDPISYKGYSNRSTFNDSIEVELSFKVEKQFDMSNIGNGEQDFYNRLTQIRRELKLDDLGI